MDIDYVKLVDQLLNKATSGVGFKTVGSTPTAVLGHGPGGLFSSPGMDPKVFSAMALPVFGLQTALPVYPNRYKQPQFSIFTGVTASGGVEPDGVCDDAPTTGLAKLCSQSYNFGRQTRMTKVFDTDSIGAFEHGHRVPGSVELGGAGQHGKVRGLQRRLLVGRRQTGERLAPGMPANGVPAQVEQRVSRHALPAGHQPLEDLIERFRAHPAAAREPPCDEAAECSHDSVNFRLTRGARRRGRALELQPDDVAQNSGGRLLDGGIRAATQRRQRKTRLRPDVTQQRQAETKPRSPSRPGCSQRAQPRFETVEQQLLLRIEMRIEGGSSNVRMIRDVRDGDAVVAALLDQVQQGFLQTMARAPHPPIGRRPRMVGCVPGHVSAPRPIRDNRRRPAG